ncbi:MAG: nucleotidyltransferase domain-containing protein [Longimicrobiaceae bacterium]
MESSIPDPDLAQLVAEASSAYSPSQAELAGEIGVRPLALTTWRQGRSRPTAEHLRGLADALEQRSERLRELAARLRARAAAQGKLTRRSRRPIDPYRATAELWAQRMVLAGRGEVLRIIFHGSRARGDARALGSDWDFVVVLNRPVTDVEADEQRFRRAALDGPSPFGSVVLDVWPIEWSEWETARQLYGHPLRAADREGIVLYAAG